MALLLAAAARVDKVDEDKDQHTQRGDGDDDVAGNPGPISLGEDWWWGH